MAKRKSKADPWSPVRRHFRIDDGEGKAPNTTRLRCKRCSSSWVYPKDQVSRIGAVMALLDHAASHEGRS